MSIELLPAIRPTRVAWNKGRIVGQKRPLQPKHVWSIRVRLEMAGDTRDLARFNMAVDSKLRGCDLVALRVRDVFAAGCVKGAGLHHAKQNRTPSPVRDYRDGPTVARTVDSKLGDARRRVPLAEPVP